MKNDLRRRPGFDWLWAAIDKSVDVLMVFAGIAVLLMMTHVTADVASRALLGRSLPGTIVIVSDYYMVACAFLPLAYTERLGHHITMDALSGRLTPRAARFQVACGHIVTLIVFGLLTYSAWLTALKKYKLGAFDMESGVRLYIWPSYWLLPIGCGVLCLFVTMRFIQFATGNLPAQYNDKMGTAS
jgi:TRAP-type C4-dicarboxylate transport system permease small subunit